MGRGMKHFATWQGFGTENELRTTGEKTVY